MRLLVTGPAGRVGTRLGPGLAAAGESVRVLVCDEDQAAALWNAGVDVIEGGPGQPEAVRRAVAERDAVVHLGGVPREDLVRAAREAGVARFLSVRWDSVTFVYGEVDAGLTARLLQVLRLSHVDGGPDGPGYPAVCTAYDAGPGSV